MKTLKSLENKTWYRACKVLYIFSFIVLAVFGATLVYGVSNTYDKNFTRITCEAGNEEAFDIKKNKLGIAATDTKISNDTRVSIATEICSIELDSAYTLSYTTCINASSGLLSCNHAYKASKGVDRVPLSRLLINLCLYAFLIVIIFEVIKRSFYYIAIGTICPKKE